MSVRQQTSCLQGIRIAESSSVQVTVDQHLAHLTACRESGEGLEEH